jgi:D-alanyl-D-alanine carboxypeptidase/D-alanyl-D-alanine-endopeptidase (penicillin-binding protein 4)
MPGVEHGVWGIVVHSLDRDERLFELNPHTLLVPASTAKLVSVASAADAVGWDFRFETTLAIGGPVVDAAGGGPGRVLRGDLLVTGSGDPSIGGRAGADLSGWVEALSAHGITRIEGHVIGDDDAVEEPRPALAWAWDDLGYTTGVLYGALNFAENRMTVTVTPGASAGMPAVLSVEAEAAARPLRGRVDTGPRGSETRVWPEQRPGEPFLTIAGAIAAGAPPARLQVSTGNPTAGFANALLDDVGGILRHRLHPYSRLDMKYHRRCRWDSQTPPPLQ